MIIAAPDLLVDVMARSVMRIVSENRGSTFQEIRRRMPASPEYLLRRKCLELAECGYICGKRPLGSMVVSYFPTEDGIARLNAADDAAREEGATHPEAVIGWLAGAIAFLAVSVFLYLKLAR